MNCRTFEMQVADWLSGRLPESISDRMAEHKATCAPCASIADAEARMRRQWSEWRTPEPTEDLWAKVEARLPQTTFGPAKRPAFNTGYRWAAAICALAIIVPGVMSLNSTPKAPVTGINVGRLPATVIPTPASTGSVYSLIADTAQGDPSIDDPIGGTMEHVWTHVSTDNKDTASR